MITFGTFLAPPLDFEELLRRSGKPAAYLITCQCFGLLPDAEIRELGAVFFRRTKKTPPRGRKEENIEGTSPDNSRAARYSLTVCCFRANQEKRSFQSIYSKRSKFQNITDFSLS